MKKLIIFLFATIIVAYTANAQSNIPNYIHLTAVARHTGSIDTPVANKIIEVQVEIWESSSDTSFASATQYYCELQHNILTNSHGEFSLDFGDPSYICGSFGMMSSIPWSSGRMWYVLLYDSSTAGILLPIDTGRIATAPYSFASRTAENLINVGSAPATGSVLTWNGSAWVAGNNPWANYLLAEEQEPSGTGAGSAVLGWQTRTLNITVDSAGTAITRSGNNITLNQAGTYYIKAYAPAYNTWDHKLAIKDLTSTTYYITGRSDDANGTYYGYSFAEVEGFITVSTSPITFILSHYISHAAGSLGDPTITGILPEVYSHILVQKIK